MGLIRFTFGSDDIADAPRAGILHWEGRCEGPQKRVAGTVSEDTKAGWNEFAAATRERWRAPSRPSRTVRRTRQGC